MRVSTYELFLPLVGEKENYYGVPEPERDDGNHEKRRICIKKGEIVGLESTDRRAW